MAKDSQRNWDHGAMRWVAISALLVFTAICGTVAGSTLRVLHAETLTSRGDVDRLARDVSFLREELAREGR